MTDLAFLACLAMIAVGAGLIFLPAGLIVGGALGAWALLRSARIPAEPFAPDDGRLT